jgi:hypothetical protein
MRTHRLFGITLASDFPFAANLPAGEGRPDLTFAVRSRAPASVPWQAEGGTSAFRLCRAAELEALQEPGLLDFYLWPGRIACHLLDPRYRFLVELRLLGSVLAYWLERRGRPSLHASAVAVNGRAAAFLSPHGAGKTGLAAALMRTGCELLTDDLLPVEERGDAFHGLPGYPQMRMWPDEALHMTGACAGLPRVHPELSKRRVPVGPDGFGTFCGSALPLACLYLPERQPDRRAPVEIREVSPRDALIELVRHSFLPHLVEAAGLQPARFDLFARLVRSVPVRRLRYPSGFDRLPGVAEALLRDLE